ncbi:hypothetical protein ACMX2H_16545 [Arthrobacter sulfonylureivorans]|uniref:hypothetical protein n=1 Tax=Arthrobacter sulfonylureivorans TaxID=2486855 RepID=UPI0039E691B3
MTNILDHRVHHPARSEGATSAAAATTQSAVGPAVPPDTQSSLTPPTDELTGSMISPWHWIMFVLMFIGPLLVIGVYEFFRFQAQITQFIEGLGFNGVRFF